MFYLRLILILKLGCTHSVFKFFCTKRKDILKYLGLQICSIWGHPIKQTWELLFKSWPLILYKCMRADNVLANSSILYTVVGLYIKVLAFRDRL